MPSPTATPSSPWTATTNNTETRLAGIDAPEKAQPFGQASKQALADQLYQRQIVIQTNKRDRYGRVIGKIIIDGTDANLQQIKRGLAWHYKAYEREQPPSERATYAAAETEARNTHRGLWADPYPTAPWDWRRK